MMVPTEVLAEQQSARAAAGAAARWGFEVASLTASTTGAARTALLERAAAGRIALLVGTQALLDAAARLPRLALAIVDEQHRFGVSRARGARARSAAAACRTCCPCRRRRSRAAWRWRCTAIWTRRS
jgi:ATP-dependent DNA helicase RecG